ncbi:hypothetical protein ACTVZO_45280 [Streptomyces sp. IBSNAI002]|uniref:hypothetical protein n=1 Tax=Streptomyces sp. IBSNAI002 TaxID=3457500 RepID=UPI003FD2DF77
MKLFKKKPSPTDEIMWRAISDLRRRVGGFGVEDLRRYAEQQYGTKLDYWTVYRAMRDGR